LAQVVFFEASRIALRFDGEEFEMVKKVSAAKAREFLLHVSTAGGPV
jgi:hypothetical protein